VKVSDAEAIVAGLHDWTVEELVEVFARVRGQGWGERVLRAECDRRELDIAGATVEWVEQCLIDGWYRDGGLLLVRLGQLRTIETLAETVPIGPRSDHTREGPALDWRRLMPSKLPHPIESLPDPPTFDVPGPREEMEVEAERRRLERERDDLPRAARLAQWRLATYRAAYENLVEARMANVVPFVMGRFRAGDLAHGTHRTKRPDEYKAAVLAAHAIASQHGETVMQALLGVSIEQLHRHREYWSEMSHDRPTRNVFSDPCLPLSIEVVRFIEDAGLESRSLVGCTDHLGTVEACCIINAARWEHAEAAPLAELRALKDAAANLRDGDYRLAMSSETSEGWLQTWLDRLRAAT
jgi:hypothetical protein